MPKPAAKKSHPHATFIESLGGPAEVAKRLREKLNIKITPEAVTMMKKRGVTKEYRPFLAAEAKAMGVKVPPNFILGAAA